MVTEPLFHWNGQDIVLQKQKKCCRFVINEVNHLKLNLMMVLLKKNDGTTVGDSLHQTLWRDLRTCLDPILWTQIFIAVSEDWYHFYVFENKGSHCSLFALLSVMTSSTATDRLRRPYITSSSLQFYKATTL